jgi:very-short-patch-repair endonuclease
MSSERRQFARALRQQMTRAQDIRCAQLRGSRLNSAKFRAAVPFDRSVAEPYYRVARLAVELDGKQHEWFAEHDAGARRAHREPHCATFASRRSRVTSSAPSSRASQR